jgi:hypothetical protein
MLEMTFLGSIKILDQYTWILYKTDDNNCNLLAKDNFLDVQELIIAVIFLSNTSQSDVVNFL